MGTQRAPRAVLRVNGTDIPVSEIEVEQSRKHESDHLHACIPFGALPAAMDANWWTTANDIAVQAIFSADGAPTTKMFDGKVDHVDHDFCGQLLTVTARCKTAAMIDAPHKDKHINKHHHEIVQDLAAAHGLTVDADAVTDKAGKLYQIDFAAIPHGSSEWTFAQRLAETANMDCYATNGTVYFKDPGEQLPVFRLNYQPPTEASYASGDFVTLKASRNLQLGRPISHKVSTWNHKDKRAYSTTEMESGGGDMLAFHHNEPGISQAQTATMAKKRLRDTTKHEFDLTIDMPGDTTVSPRVTLELSGTGTAYDQQHEINSITHRQSYGEGYRMTISTKAKSGKRGQT